MPNSQDFTYNYSMRKRYMTCCACKAHYIWPAQTRCTPDAVPVGERLAAVETHTLARGVRPRRDHALHPAHVVHLQRCARPFRSNRPFTALATGVQRCAVGPSKEHAR
jgi:hypothetical protein